MNNCILLACYLPSIKKRYVLKEILEYLSRKETGQTVFIGIQSNSIPETEEFIRKSKGNLKIKTRRVTPEMMIDSDASSFIAALELYKESDMNFDRCYFCHTKGITSNNDQLRQHMFKLLFDGTLIKESLADEKVGSYAPFLTCTNIGNDIGKMSSMRRFISDDILKYPVMEYYYINTFFILKNHILKRFISNVDDSFFTTNINEYSDRYFFERDFSHIADMMGYEPSYFCSHGNYSTGYLSPSLNEINKKFNKWKESMKYENR